MAGRLPRHPAGQGREHHRRPDQRGQPRFRPGGCTVEGASSPAGTFGVTQTPTGDGVRIVWHHQASDQTRTFTVSYRVTGGNHVVAYDDVIDVYWQVWGDQWDFDLDHLTATFTDPALRPHPARSHAGEPVRRVRAPARGRGPGLPRDRRARLVPTTSPITPSSRCESGPAHPGPGISRRRPGEGDGLPAILAEEQGVTDDYNSLFNRTKRWIADNAVLLSLILAGIGLGGLFLMARLATEHPTSTPKHLPEPPDEASPALAYGLAHEGGDSTDTVLATLIDLVDRGYYKATSATTEDEKLDLALAVEPASKRPKKKLEPHEKEVLDFFDELLEGDTVPMSEMRDRIPEHSASWRSKWESMTSALNSVDEGQLAWDRNLNGAKWLLILGLAIGFAVIVLCDIDVNERFVIPGAIGLLTVIALAVYPWSRLKRLDPEYGERSAKWRAFERWTRDFPSLKDDPPATLELWKRILVFGVAFGTAERMIESGRIPAPVMESTSTGLEPLLLRRRGHPQRLRRQLVRLGLRLPGRPGVLQRRGRWLLGWRRRWWRRRGRRGLVARTALEGPNRHSPASLERRRAADSPAAEAARSGSGWGAAAAGARPQLSPSGSLNSMTLDAGLGSHSPTQGGRGAGRRAGRRLPARRRLERRALARLPRRDAPRDHDHDRRPDRARHGRAAPDPGADRRRRRDLHQRLRVLSALLPLARDAADGPARAQPRRAGQHRARRRLRDAEGRRDAARLARALRTTARSTSARCRTATAPDQTYVPPGWRPFPLTASSTASCPTRPRPTPASS